MSGKIIRIFFDTNVWFSSLYGSENCQKLTDAHQDEKIIVVISPLVLDEVVRNVKKKIPDYFDDLQKYLLGYPPEVVPNPSNIPHKFIGLVSPQDLPIFVSAVQANVDFFVTGNIKDFQVDRLEKLTKIKIMTPKEAVKALKL